MNAPQSGSIPRAQPHARRRRLKATRGRWPIWPASIVVASAGVLFSMSVVVVRHWMHRDPVAQTAEGVAAPATTPMPLPVASPTSSTPSPSKPAATIAERRRDRSVTVDSFKYREPPKDAAELTEQLASVREIGLERPLDDPLMKDLIDGVRGRTGASRPFHPFAMAMNDVHRLPLRMGLDCQLERHSAEILQQRSRRLREHLAKSTIAASVRKSLREDGAEVWREPSAIPTLVQMLQAEDRGLRLLLVELLSRIEGREASRALARRAMFDVSAEVRHAAVQALRKRSKSDFREVLVAGLRHPWPAAADFAATALIELRATLAVPALIAMLDEPNPAAPFALNEGGKQTHYVRDMVRINHLRNCVVCHAVSFDASHLVRAAAPDPNAPLPPAFTPAYYRPSVRPDDRRLFVRADITYLTQDFSLPQPVENPGVWPAHQRYDYCVSTRPLSTAEWDEMRQSSMPYPQREAVLFALRELTGEDRGDKSSDWQPLIARYSQ